MMAIIAFVFTFVLCSLLSHSDCLCTVSTVTTTLYIKLTARLIALFASSILVIVHFKLIGLLRIFLKIFTFFTQSSYLTYSILLPLNFLYSADSFRLNRFFTLPNEA